MMYVSIEKALESIDLIAKNDGKRFDKDSARYAIQTAEPAADVVEVVRCKDCVHSCFIRSCSKYECQKGFGALKFSNDFCSYGERRKDELSKATNS